eukprot:1762430-Amphidinium_carterae.1
MESWRAKTFCQYHEDFVKHPIKPAVAHRPEERMAPPGTFDAITTYASAYVGHMPRPRIASRNHPTIMSAFPARITQVDFSCQNDMSKQSISVIHVS